MIAWLRSWLAGFGHPRATDMLPDPVTVTVQLAVDEKPDEFVALIQKYEPGNPPETGWQMIDVLPGQPGLPGCEGLRVVIRRTDGAYRSRDDSMQGY